MEVLLEKELWIAIFFLGKVLIWKWLMVENYKENVHQTALLYIYVGRKKSSQEINSFSGVSSENCAYGTLEFCSPPPGTCTFNLNFRTISNFYTNFWNKYLSSPFSISFCAPCPLPRYAHKFFPGTRICNLRTFLFSLDPWWSKNGGEDLLLLWW